MGSTITPLSKNLRTAFSFPEKFPVDNCIIKNERYIEVFHVVSIKTI